MIVCLKALGEKSTADIAQLVGASTRVVNQIYARAKQRGFDPAQRPLVIKNEHIEDAARSGRPSKQSPDLKATVEAKLREIRYGREKSCGAIAGELNAAGHNISATTIWNMLKKAGFRKTKPTRKPGLTKRMREQRLKWCLDHSNWTLDDWKNVIWSDETSVILQHRRGGYRVWRQPNEQFVRSCIRERWRGASEFMFWGCFTYDKKGPFHCWAPESAKDRREAEKKLDDMNRELEPIMKEQWEVTNGMRRLDINRQPPGRRPEWKWCKQTGKLTRGGKGGKGIDWYRHQNEILIPKLLPFAKECMEERPGTIVQEDNAPCHNHYIQARVYDLHQITRMLWCPNSPDLNAIEPTWMYMKRWTTKRGAPSKRANAIRVWSQCWREMPQHMIRAWIERIPMHVQKIIELEGGNEYKEGRARLGRGENAIVESLQNDTTGIELGGNEVDDEGWEFEEDMIGSS